MTVVDTARHRVVDTIAIPGPLVRPMGNVVAPDEWYVFVTTGRGRLLAVVETSTHEVLGTVEVGERPWGVAIAHDGATVFTANGPSNDVAVVDVATRRVTARVPVGDRPWGAAYLFNQAAPTTR